MNRQSGNVLLWVVLGVVAVGLGAVIVWRYFAATDSLSDAQQATEQTAVITDTKGVKVDESLLPDAWNIVTSDSNSVVVNDATGEPDESYCFVQIVKQTDTKAKAADPSHYAEVLYDGTISSMNVNKGYVATHLSTVDLSVQQNQKTVSFIAHTDKLTPPENGTPKYQRNGYVVNPVSGNYYAVTQSCGENDFSGADEALKAFSIGS